MISLEALKKAIREAIDTVRGREEEVNLAKARLTEAERELKLLGELAQLRGLGSRELAQLSAPRFTDTAPNGSSDEAGGRTPSPARTVLLTAVIGILADRGEPMQIRDLMTAVQERGVAIPGSGQQANLIAHISRDERIVRPRRGFYALREWGVAEAKPPARTKRRRVRRRSGAKA